MAHTGWLRPKRGIFFRLQVYDRVGILLVEVYARVGKSAEVIMSVKGPKGLTGEFYGFIKSRKRSFFVIDSYLNDSAFQSINQSINFI